MWARLVWGCLMLDSTASFLARGFCFGEFRKMDSDWFGYHWQRMLSDTDTETAVLIIQKVVI